jgi:hypothetical protein
MGGLLSANGRMIWMHRHYKAAVSVRLCRACRESGLMRQWGGADEGDGQFGVLPVCAQVEGDLTDFARYNRQYNPSPVSTRTGSVIRASKVGATTNAGRHGLFRRPNTAQEGCGRLRPADTS